MIQLLRNVRRAPAFTLAAVGIYGVVAYDPVTLIVVTCFLVPVALAAIYLPARRAALADPMVALRND